MPSRYGSRGGRYYSPNDRNARGAAVSALGSSYSSSPEPAETAQDRQNDEGADFWRFVGDVAPMAGTVLGGVAGGVAGGMAGGPVGALGGAGAGAQLGSMGGQAVGQFATSQGDRMTADREDEVANHALEEQRKQDRKAALVNALMQMRR